MKYYIHIIGVISILFIGCSKEPIVESVAMADVRINMVASDPQTRSVSAIRYIVEIWGVTVSGEKGMLDNKTFNSDDISFRIPIGTYDFHLWADYGANNYDAGNLSSVTVSTTASNRECFAGNEPNKEVTAEKGLFLEATLTRPVARINLIQSVEGIAPDEGKLVKICYPSVPISYNVINKSTNNTKDNYEVTTTCVTANQGTEPFAWDYVFIPVDEKINLEVAIDDKAPKELNNITIEKNKQTNITAKFEIQ